MGHPGSSADHLAPIVADASLWIALAATDCAAEVLSALARPVLITDVAQAELERGRAKGRQAAAAVELLVASERVRVVTLPPSTLEIFSDLVIGEGPETLDDGEAATIAMAHTLNGAAVIDERKARRMAQERFATLELRCTAELLLAQEVVAALGPARCANAIFAALRETRLRVPTDFLGTVLSAIGVERARQCPSLPARSRTAS